VIFKPDGLGVRGSALWDVLTSEKTWDAAGSVLLGEACRTVDRLEKLDQLLRREIGAWAEIVEDFDHGRREIHLEIDDALAESRQQQGSLLQLLTKLGLGRSKSPAAAQEDPLDELVRQWAAGGSAPADSDLPEGR
jgi:hypothetical protein